MDYISLMNRFWTLNRQATFEPADSHLYGCLLDYFNGKGVGKLWPESLPLTDGALSLLAGINVKTMDRARTRLIDRGLIQVAKLGQGSRAGSEYRITSTSPTTYPATSPTTYPKKGEVNGSTSVEMGEVNGQLPPQHTPQLLPQHTPKKEKSLYIGIQTPDSQTPNIFFAAAAAREEIDLVEDKKEEAPAPPTPSPPAPPKPIPIPTGKTYGDGKLQADVLAYYAQFPDQFPLSTYLPFIRHWTQVFQKGSPDLIGTERWRSMDTWDTETRLDTWHKNDLKFAEKDKNNGNKVDTTSAIAGAAGSGQAGPLGGEIIRTEYSKQTFGRSHSRKSGIPNA